MNFITYSPVITVFIRYDISTAWSAVGGNFHVFTQADGEVNISELQEIGVWTILITNNERIKKINTDIEQ